MKSMAVLQLVVLFLMIRRPPRSTRTDTLFPYTTLFRSPHITELIFAAGAGDKIVGTVSSSDFPAAAKAIPRVGDGMNANVENTLTLRPDVVIAWQPSGAAQTLAPTLSRLGIPLLRSEERRVGKECAVRVD